MTVKPPDMSNFFMAGQDVVRWDVAAVDPNGPFRLTIHHPAGTIVEYYPTATAALVREQAIESLLTTARTAAPRAQPTA
ncbi:MAG TPA: hypothetical protein VGY57_16805 [Vicinamibacterales bacterium]|nr:hypothetical protein [Vicinamibacterales bacterium]